MSTRIDPNGLKNAWTEWMAGLGNLTQGPAGQVYKEWESWFGAQFEKLAKNETFLGQTAKSMENSFLLKSQFDRMMETSARAMRMPTAGDIESVHKRLDEMERRLDAVLAKLEKQAAKADAGETGEGTKAAKAPRRAPAKAEPGEG